MRTQRPAMMLFPILFLLVPCGLLAQAPTDGLVAYYPFNGNGIDAGGLGHNAISFTATPAPDRFGNPGAALLFDGGNEVVLPNQFQSASLTVSVWINPAQEGWDRTILTMYRDVTHFFKFVKSYRDGYSAAFARAGSMEYAWAVNSTIGAVPLNQWSLLCLVLDGVDNTARFYINGVLQDEQTMGGSTLLDLGAISVTSIGKSYDTSTDNFIGAIDDMRFYSRALTTAEVHLLAADGGIADIPPVWEKLPGPTVGWIGGLLFDGLGNLYLATEKDGLWRSTDAGFTWHGLTPTADPMWNVSVAAGLVPGHILMTTYGGGYANRMYRSTDGGDNWSTVTLPFSSDVRRILSTRDGRFYAGTSSDKVWRSDDDGLTWTLASSGITEPVVSPMMETREGNILVGTRRVGDDYSNGFVFRSSDNGGMWMGIGPTNIGPVYSLAQDSTGQIFVGTDTKDFDGVFGSTDDGMTWNATNAGLPGPRILDLLVGKGDTLYAANYLRGVYRRIPGSAEWSAYNAGLSDLGVSTLALGPKGQLYAGTANGHLYRVILHKGRIEGRVMAGVLPVAGVTVKLLDQEGIPVPGALLTTDNSGGYAFPEIEPGEYQVMIVEPLGYLCDANPRLASVAPGGTTVVDFQLTLQVVVNQALGKGYWKHQFDVFVTGKGHAQESRELLEVAISTVQEHYTPHYPFFETTETFAEWQRVLSPKAKGTILNKALQHLAALVLNLGSMKVGQYTVVTADGRDVGDVLTYVSDLLSDGISANDETAKNLAEMVNEQQLIPAGWVPAGSMLYKGKGKMEWGEDGPQVLALHGNYPNPFNPSTTIAYELPRGMNVSIRVFNGLGQEVGILEEGFRAAGRHTVVWNASGQASGVYFCRMQAEDFVQIRRLLLVR